MGSEQKRATLSMTSHLLCVLRSGDAAEMEIVSLRPIENALPTYLDIVAFYNKHLRGFKFVVPLDILLDFSSPPKRAHCNVRGVSHIALELKSDLSRNPYLREESRRGQISGPAQRVTHLTHCSGLLWGQEESPEGCRLERRSKFTIEKHEI